MKKLLIVISILFLTGCSQEDEEQLKQDIKDELTAEITAELTKELEFTPSMLNEHLTDVTELVSYYTVAIEVDLGTGTTFGSGLLISKSDNTYQVITNEHVIRYHQSIDVYVPSLDKYYTATALKVDQATDLALLEFSTTDSLTVYTINDCSFEVGEIVLAVGSSTAIEYANTITIGIISRIDDEVIQHDASINNGNSGGPLFNIEGDLIGINFSKLNTTYSGTTRVFVEGMGFAIPLQTVKDFLNN